MTKVGRRRPRSLVLLGWLALAAVSRAPVKASASASGSETESLHVGTQSSATAETDEAQPAGILSNNTVGVSRSRHVAASSSSTSSLIRSSIVMDEDPCRTSFRHVCDPDNILSPEDVRRVQQELDDYPRSVTCEGKDVPVQVAVALVSKMDYHTTESEDGDEDVDVTTVAETFARSIHDKWGVGYDSACGGTGAVVFLAVHDRAMFITRGSALEPYLTDARLDAVLRDMRPMLRRQQYGDAVLWGVQELFRYVESGEPSIWEKAQDYAWVGLLVLVFLLAYWSSRRDQERRRQYAEMTSHLSELDRAQAEVLQGKYHATSCPICLEAFPMADISESSTRSCENNNNNGSSCHGEERLGSDGMPLKLLRCGHCFDDTCFLEWVRTGNGQVDKCPICKAPVGSGASGDVFGNNEGSESSHSPPLRPRRTIGNAAPDPTGYGETILPRRMQGGSIRIQFDPVAAALRTYNQERVFRLGRLQGRYPQFVGPREVQRWSDPTYEGSLARDPAVLNRDPFRANSVGRKGGSATFGGGTSSGGRGGRW